MTPEDRDPLTRWLDRPEVLSDVRQRNPVVDGHSVTPLSLETWRRYTPHPAARRLASEYEGRTISRLDLAIHAGEALTQPDEERWVRAYMACQIWGVGTTGRVGWTGRTLADPDAPAAFAQLARAVQDGQPERAAGNWAYGWNRSFTTKFAYAVSKALNLASPAALVYDERVEKQLRRIGWRFPMTRGGRTPWRKYAGYLDAVHAEALRLDCQPDTIEWVLFAPPANS